MSKLPWIVMMLVLAGATNAWADAPARDETPGANGTVTAARLPRCAIDLAQAASGQAQPKEEKKRVPKEEEKEKKPEKTEGQTPPPAADDEGGFFGACLGTCVGSFFSGLFGGDEEEVVTPVVATEPTMIVAAPPGSVPEIGHGYIQHVDSLQTPVQLWDGPGGAEHGYARVALLAPGTEVGVTDARAFESGDWIEVQYIGGPLVQGWVEAEHVDWVAHQAPPATPVMPVAGTVEAAGTTATGPSWTPLGTQTVAFMADVSWFYLTGPREVREEYEYGGLRGAFCAVMTPASSFQVTLGLGYGEEIGEPLYDYETATTIESPHDSRLQMFDVGLRFGQYTPLGGGRARVYWGMGPAFYWVKESADIDITAAATGLPLGQRTEEHSWSRFGADAAIGFSYEVGSRFHLGGLVRGIWVSWDAEGKESLTLDWIGDKSLAGFGIGLSLAYDAF